MRETPVKEEDSALKRVVKSTYIKKGHESKTKERKGYNVPHPQEDEQKLSYKKRKEKKYHVNGQTGYKKGLSKPFGNRKSQLGCSTICTLGFRSYSLEAALAVILYD